MLDGRVGFGLARVRSARSDRVGRVESDRVCRSLDIFIYLGHSNLRRTPVFLRGTNLSCRKGFRETGNQETNLWATHKVLAVDGTLKREKLRADQRC